MKTNAILRIVLWSVILLVLSGILLAALGGRPSRHGAEASMAAVPIDEVPADPEQSEGAVKASSIREISIEWVAGNITIAPKEGIDQINFREHGTEVQHKMDYCITDSKLVIRYSQERFRFSGLNINTDYAKDLTIDVPVGWMCEELELDVAASDFTITDMTIREVDFDGASGSCDFQNCTIGDLDIDAASGDVTFTGNLETLDFDAASAKFQGDFLNTPDRLDMDGMSGSMDIGLPQDGGFRLSLNGISSHFQSDLSGIRHEDNLQIWGDGRCRIHVDGMSSHIMIRQSTAVPESATP